MLIDGRPNAEILRLKDLVRAREAEIHDFKVRMESRDAEIAHLRELVDAAVVYRFDRGWMVELEDEHDEWRAYCIYDGSSDVTFPDRDAAIAHARALARKDKP